MEGASDLEFARRALGPWGPCGTATAGTVGPKELCFSSVRRCGGKGKPAGGSDLQSIQSSILLYKIF